MVSVIDPSRPVYDYISYSARLKEKNSYLELEIPYYSKVGVDLGHPKGIINSHAEGIHFAWLMREASELFGDSEYEQRWRELITKYHQGSKELFKELHPMEKKYQGQSHIYWGVLRYGIGSGMMDPWYNAISYRGISAGYEFFHKYEIEFVDAIERAYDYDYAYIYYTNIDPNRDEAEDYKNVLADCGDSPFVARLCRVFPVLLSFVGPGAKDWKARYVDHTGEAGEEGKERNGSNKLNMSHNIRGSASIREVLKYEQLERRNLGSTTGTHVVDPDTGKPLKFIVEGGDQRWIKTNADFETNWIPGFWEEKEEERVPFRMRFSVYPHWRPTQCAAPKKRWTVCRRGDVLYVLANHTLEGMRITFPISFVKKPTYNVYFREYNNHTWGNLTRVHSGTAIDNNGKTEIQVPRIPTKTLAVIYLHNFYELGFKVPLLLRFFSQQIYERAYKWLAKWF